MVTLSQIDIRTKRLLPWLVAIAFFMEALDTTILNTAVPMIAKALDVTPLSMKSVLSSYTLSLAVFIPISSWMADRFGTRRVFSAAIALFTFGSFLCGISTSIHALVISRIIQGCGGAMMVPVGRLTLVRSFHKSELVRTMSFVAIPALIGPMLGPLAGGLIVAFLNWRMIFFVNLPIGLLGLYLVYRHLPNYQENKTPKPDIIGLILFGSGIALFSYVLEVFGEHVLGVWEILGLLGLSFLLLFAYFLHAKKTPFPLLKLSLMRIRTMRIAVLGNFITRLGVGGLPFLLPLLYQLGLGFTPVQSGLLIMPQSIAAISLRLFMPSILKRLGYKHVLLSNTILLGVVIFCFSRIDLATPVWLIVILAASFGFLSSLQFSSMNTLVYADVDDKNTSMASTIVSTVQQMSLSFGVATASLAAAYFIPDRNMATIDELLNGIHHAFVFLGMLTVISAICFWNLKSDDGDNVSQHRAHAPVHH